MALPVNHQHYRGCMKTSAGSKGDARTLKRELIQFGWVGPVNFLVGYGSFLLLLDLFSEFDYWLALVTSHIVGSSVAFFLYRRYVFRAVGNLLWDFLRFQSAYVFALILNIMILFLLADILGWRVEIAQLFALLLVAGATFFTHKFFTFFRGTRLTRARH